MFEHELLDLCHDAINTQYTCGVLKEIICRFHLVGGTSLPGYLLVVKYSLKFMKT